MFIQKICLLAIYYCQFVYCSQPVLRCLCVCIRLALFSQKQKTTKDGKHEIDDYVILQNHHHAYTYSTIYTFCRMPILYNECTMYAIDPYTKSLSILGKVHGIPDDIRIHRSTSTTTPHSRIRQCCCEGGFVFWLQPCGMSLFRHFVKATSLCSAGCCCCCCSTKKKPTR